MKLNSCLVEETDENIKFTLQGHNQLYNYAKKINLAFSSPQGPFRNHMVYAYYKNILTR